MPTIGALLTTGQKLASYCPTEPAQGRRRQPKSAPSWWQRIRHQRQQSLYQRRRQHRCVGAYIRTGDARIMPAASAPLLVPADTPGITYGKRIQDGLEQPAHPAPSALTTCASPPTTCCGRRRRRLQDRHEGLDGGRINIATCSVGAAQGALNQAQQYMQDRKQFRQKHRQLPGHCSSSWPTWRPTGRRPPNGAPGRQQTRRRARDATTLLRHGQALRHRCGLYRERGPVNCTPAATLHPRIPAGALLRDARVHPDSGRHQRNHARHHRPPHAGWRCAGGDSHAPTLARTSF